MVGNIKCELVLALVLFKCLHYVKTVLLDEALKMVQGDPSTEQNQKKNMSIMSYNKLFWYRMLKKIRANT